MAGLRAILACMDLLLASIQPVLRGSQLVAINHQALQAFADKVQAGDLEGSEFAGDTFLPKLTEEESIAFALVYDSINFSYWGDPKWAVTVDGQMYDGSAAMVRALERGITRGIPLLSAAYLATLSEKTFAEILHGNTEIPLFTERQNMLNTLGRAITEKYGGSWTAFVDAAQWDAEKIVLKLVAEMPTVFDDVADYHGHTVRFYKRAQLLPAHLHDLYRLRIIPRDASNIGKLTAFADYKVPQLLRRLGILVYDQELSDAVDRGVELPAQSEAEIAIRANTIQAIELATQEVKKRLPTATAMQVDGVLWLMSQEKSGQDRPYHRTRTIWY